jgi:hypothetical protein
MALPVTRCTGADLKPWQLNMAKASHQSLNAYSAHMQVLGSA